MSAAGPPRRGDVRVVTLNLWGGYYPLRQQVIGRMRPGGERPAAWTARQAALTAGLRALRPDLVAFQEALRTNDFDQVVELLGPGYRVAHQARREPTGPARRSPAAGRSGGCTRSTCTSPHGRSRSSPAQC